MIEGANICPYTGLRPFTEDESLYFKGRDEHIDQATKQLEKNKFIMLTGASGDGKSSLVYAGIIPNAKAGFLKSQYSSWAVADFRPERSPLDNLSHALAKQLGIASEATVRTELRHGFSALVDVYKASQLYLDPKEEDLSKLDEAQQALRKRSAANLIIIADQFEEFFTNPENFHKGVPSQEASLVTNLLLETARIALEEKLPIYVIITMRSDFIGQCAAFRGLPEAIGFSQFFVPRLNRAQLQEVIEEPAKLSGNRISRRLTERLIHDMVEGTDQLPILQHTLNQVWKMADEGRAEMDLLHYAMVGGMKGEELPSEEASKFRKWFETLSSKIQGCYAEPGLHNVLNTHANKLYNFASAQENREKLQISEHDAQQIIQTTFKCLTKIDNGRAVRNRMSLDEITAIINQPHVNPKKVAHILSAFRESGNTLLRPFQEEVGELEKSSVLDITHESLIRNWENLAEWAKEEFASYNTFLDFSQQLNRWVESRKSSSFLLYIGPLTFFEEWFQKVKPNVEWIARYLGEELDHAQRESKAKKILSNAEEFLQRSARKHTITRTVMKYGPRRIAAAFAIVAFLGLSSFAFKTYLDRRNSSILQDIKAESIVLVNNPKLSFADRAKLICNQLQLDLTTIPKVVENTENPLEQITMANAITVSLIFEGRTEPAYEIGQGLDITDSLLSIYEVDYSNAKEISDYLKNLSEWRATLGLGHFYNPSEDMMELQRKNGRYSANAILALLKGAPTNFDDLSNFTNALETAINFNAFSEEEMTYVIQSLSPFENVQKSDWVANHFNRDQLLLRGYQGYGFTHNGLYQDLACLYAATGNVPLSLNAIDTLLKYSDAYYARDYTNSLDNATNVASVFYRSGNAELLDGFVKGYIERKGISESEFYERLMGRAKPYQLTRNTNYQNFWPESNNLNLQYGEAGEIRFFYERWRDAINKISNKDQRNFLLAKSFKHEGITIAYRAEVVQAEYDKASVNALFDLSLDHYSKVGEGYLSEMVDRVGSAGSNNLSVARKSLYLFPDLIYPFIPLGARDFHLNYMSTSFIEYLIDRDLFKKWYGDREQIELIEEWIKDYQVHALAGDIMMRHHARLESLIKIEGALSELEEAKRADLNLLHLLIGDYLVEKGDHELALTYYRVLKPENFGNLFIEKVFRGPRSDGTFNYIGTSFASFLEYGDLENAERILGYFKKPANRSSIYAFTARAFYDKGLGTDSVSAMLDSALLEMKRVENLNSPQPNRFRIAVGLISSDPGKPNVQRAKEIIKNQELKFIVLQRMARAMAYRDQLFEATQLVPLNISDADRVQFLTNILQGYIERTSVPTGWEEYSDTYRWFQKSDFLPYVDETE
ncbi:MAG: ATP-binding protein [Cyclobacteriaceae bacterium]